MVFFIFFRDDIKALLLRIAKIRFPGGTEVSTSQSEKLREEDGRKTSKESKPATISGNLGLPEDLDPSQRKRIEELLNAEKATAYHWEYKYLNYFLVRGTQFVLDWLVNLDRPANFREYVAVWGTLVPSHEERMAILNALANHYLINLDGETISVTEKGKEYREWRGDIPPLPSSSVIDK